MIHVKAYPNQTESLNSVVQTPNVVILGNHDKVLFIPEQEGEHTTTIIKDYDDKSFINYRRPNLEYLTLTALEDNTNFYMFKRASPTVEEDANLEYSVDYGDTWQTYTMPAAGENGDIIVINKGDTILLRGNNPDGFNQVYFTGSWVNNRAYYINSNTGSLKVSGHIWSLMFGDNYKTYYNYELPGTGCFGRLFQYCENLVDASELYFGDKFADTCFGGLFYGCTSLTKVPKLPKKSFITLTEDSCYAIMFCDCTSLVDAPELPATVLSNACYYGMFWGCTSLVTAPKLPATTLGALCYGSMFADCTALLEAPELPVTELKSQCYRYMFNGCTSLTAVPELPATTMAKYCYMYMFSGCTGLTTAPDPVATTLADYCFKGMYYQCTSLVNIPSVLPVEVLCSNCYSYMFAECTSLTHTLELPSQTLATQCYGGMFRGCTGLVDDVCDLPCLTLQGTDCYACMFRDCTNLIKAPNIMATKYCYCSCEEMFMNCTSLEEAPLLRATELATYCFSNLFRGCSSLRYIKAMFTTTPGGFVTGSWVTGVSSTGVFVKNANATWDVTGESGIPEGWTVETAVA